MDDRSQFAAELLITECVLCDVKGISPDAINLQKKFVVVRNIKRIAEALAARPNSYGKINF